MTEEPQQPPAPKPTAAETLHAFGVFFTALGTLMLCFLGILFFGGILVVIISSMLNAF